MIYKGDEIYMIKIFVDSGSSIKKEELKQYDVEILPLKILLGNKEYLDGENLGMEEFYKMLMTDKLFPKTSLPALDDAFERVNKYTEQGYDVLIITISSGISGTYSAIKMLFQDNDKVKVVDSLNAVGGVKILVKEACKYLNDPIDKVVEKLNSLAKRIVALAVPETLDYLKKGGRLSGASWAIGTILKIKPIIELKNTVKVAGKTIGIKNAMKFLIAALENCDTNYPIVPSFTYDDKNLNELIKRTPNEYTKMMLEKDNLTPAISCHWGPNAFGYVFVEKE